MIESNPLMRWMLVGLMLAAIAGCGPKRYEDPVATMLDRGRTLSQRIDAAEQAETRMPDAEARWLALRRLVMDAGHPAALRMLAMDQMLRQDAAEARRFFRKAIVLLNNWDALMHMMQIAVDRQWAEFTPAVVRNYARPAYAFTDEDRPEREILVQLNPAKTPEQVIFAVLNDDDGATVVERAAAWQLLARLVDDDEVLIAMLEQAWSNDPLVNDLKAAARDLHVVPDNTETIAWLQMLRTEAYAGFYRDTTATVASLSPDQRSGLELRHLPALVWLKRNDDPLLGRSWAELMAGLRQTLARREHHLKSAPMGGQNPDHPQQLADWADELSWADLVVMHLVMQTLDNPRVADALFAQADADHQDTTTEYGGLLAWRENQPTAVLYKPMIRHHDRKYIPPAAMTTDGYSSLAHYHFHAHEHENRKYAGPGRGDLKSVGDRQQLNGLTLTFIDRDTLNADFYRHGRVVVDLGTIRRP